MRKLLVFGMVLLLLLGGVALAENETIVLSFAGDCTLGSMKEYQKYAGHFVAKIGDLGFEYPFSGVYDIFAGDDLTLVNLEGTFTNEKKSMDKRFLFKAPPEYAEILPLGSVEAVNIANNHINDFLDKGREDTMAALEANGVIYSGGGILATYEVKGITIGMTGYTYPHRLTMENLTKDIAALKKEGCDVIIVSLHAGTEEVYQQGGDQKKLARGAIDLGADIVVGHHPHVLQGVEVYEGKPIFYSLGNFSFGGNSNPKDWDTMIAQVVIEKTADDLVVSEMRVIPCLISGAPRGSDYRPVVAEGKQAESIMRKVRRYSINVDDSLFETGRLSLVPQQETKGED